MKTPFFVIAFFLTFIAGFYLGAWFEREDNAQGQETLRWEREHFHKLREDLKAHNADLIDENARLRLLLEPRKK
jgi:hypothetical protein